MAATGFAAFQGVAGCAVAGLRAATGLVASHANAKRLAPKRLCRKGAFPQGSRPTASSTVFPQVVGLPLPACRCWSSDHSWLAASLLNYRCPNACTRKHNCLRSQNTLKFCPLWNFRVSEHVNKSPKHANLSNYPTCYKHRETHILVNGMQRTEIRKNSKIV